jgi:hypothetical protein
VVVEELGLGHSQLRAVWQSVVAKVQGCGGWLGVAQLQPRGSNSSGLPQQSRSHEAQYAVVQLLASLTTVHSPVTGLP